MSGRPEKGRIFIERYKTFPKVFSVEQSKCHRNPNLGQPDYWADHAVHSKKTKRKWAFFNMMSIIRYHLMTYIDLFKFLKKPDGDWRELNNMNQNQLSLFQT